MVFQQTNAHINEQGKLSQTVGRLEEKSDLELIDSVVQNACVFSLNVLAERHGGIYWHFCRKFARMIRQDLKELLGEKMFFVYEAAIEYHRSVVVEKRLKCDFSTFVGNKAKYQFLNILNKQTRHKKFIKLTDYERDNPGLSESLQDEFELVMNLIKESNDDRVGKIFEMRYFSNDKHFRNWWVIAEHLNMSTQGVLNLHNKYIETFRKRLAAKGTCGFNKTQLTTKQRGKQNG